MNRLPKGVQEIFCHGYFVAKLTPGIFNSIWMDYVLEATENKALKSSGGIIGLTYQDSAVTRWFPSRPVTARYPVDFKESYTQQEESSRHHTDTDSYKKLYNEDEQKWLICLMTHLLVYFHETALQPD